MGVDTGKMKVWESYGLRHDSMKSQKDVASTF